MYVDEATLRNAIRRLNGTAFHMLENWLTFKLMGLAVGERPVEIDTLNSTEFLKCLFSCGDPNGRFFVPFSHTGKNAKMQPHASRSIIQTNAKRWSDSGSIVTCDPTGYLDFREAEDKKILVSCGRRYPIGLGHGPNGFARGADARVSLPLTSFSVWYGRVTPIPDDLDEHGASAFLEDLMLNELNISPVERDLVFVQDDIAVSFSDEALTDAQIYQSCLPYMIEGRRRPEPTVTVVSENERQYNRRVRSMVSNLDSPMWLRSNPDEDFRQLLESGAKAILLYGPPRTGKTRLIDKTIPRSNEERSTIQIHDGWAYDHLVEGFQPDPDGKWNWKDGPLKEAINQDKKYIVLEEINRTAITQALGEVFSLIEEAYRGPTNTVELRSGERFFIPEDVIFILTMNNVDKSTEEIDDALMGRIAAIEFRPRPESLTEMLTANGVPESLRSNVGQLYSAILDTYPLGHGYFAGIGPDADEGTVIQHYKTRVRPVLVNHLGVLKREEIQRIDNIVDELFWRAR